MRALGTRMTIKRLDHVNLFVEDLDRSIRWYTDILDMKRGPAAGLPDHLAAWMYDDGGVPVVHLNKAGAIQTGNVDAAGLEGSGVIQHVAFLGAAADYPKFSEKLKAKGVAYDYNYVEAISMHQLFVKDPSGVLIELNFR
jgi:catechol 2,3-dioxygenase-like lactoylglutathione lyase family enzyme